MATTQRERAPQIANIVTSCPSCFSWGLTYRQGMCLACYKFSGHRRLIGDCGACGRREYLNKGYCRLCWVQASLERPTGPKTRLEPYVRNVRHQQLFLTGVAGRPVPRKHRESAEGFSLKPAPPVVGRPQVIWVQLALFVVPRRYRYGRVDLRWDPLPENQWLAWALHLAHTMAEARGFHQNTRHMLKQTLVMLLAEHRDGELIHSSDFHNVRGHDVRGRNVSIRHTSEVLERMGVLLDDRPTTFEKWLADKLEGLAPGIRSETERWVRALHDGGMRTRTRSPKTVRSYLGSVRPSLLEWSERYNNLRQVTRADILANAEPLYGQERQIMLVASRSLFAWAKKSGVVFRDPASRIKVHKSVPPLLQPLHPEEITRTIKTATKPEARLFVALAAVHAARAGAVRAMQLNDVDLPNRRLTIVEHTRPLDELTHRALIQWLDYRRRRWPNTANKHLVINQITANGLGPVSNRWPSEILRGRTATLERLRIDRQLEEALTHRADPLHLAAVFDINESTAIRYATSARQLLEQQHEAPPSGSPQTKASISNNDSNKHSGSH